MVEKRDIDIVLDNPVVWEYFRDQVVLVTGATGRLGIYFVETLCELNIRWNMNITIVAQIRSSEKAKNVFGESVHLPFIQFIEQDITDDISLDVKIDYIIHTAGLASPSDFTRDPVSTIWGHVKGTRNILELARLTKTKRILYISTVEVYGDWPKEELISESDMGPLDCGVSRSCYPEAKRLCESLLAAYKAQYDIDFVSIRMSHTFGPGISLNDGRAFAEFIRRMIAGENIEILSDGKALRTYTYVADAIGGAFLALTKGRDNYYNIAADENKISIGALASLIASHDPSGKTKVIYLNSERSSNFQYLNFNLGLMDTTRIRGLGWEPFVNLEDAFYWTIKYFRQLSNLR